MKKLKGIPVSPGIAIAKVFIHNKSDIIVQKYKIKATAVPKEIARFEDALTKTRAELLAVRKKISEGMGREHSEIFNAHLLILEDRTLIEEVISRLRSEKVNVEYIFSDIVDSYAQAFLEIDDTYLKERTSDIQDIGLRVLRNLTGKTSDSLSKIKENVIIVSRDLTPSETAQMDKKFVIGFLTSVGGPTSHTAILARSLGIPAVVGIANVRREMADGDTLILDGNTGVIIVRPTAKQIAKYEEELDRLNQLIQKLSEIKDLPAKSLDEHPIDLSANIEFPSEIDSVHYHGASGIGLYRTEYLHLNRVDLPSEDEQFHAYKTVAERMKGSPVVIRTLDIGGDKFSKALNMPEEMNSFMGCRAIRFCFERVDIFKTQLRAILRASHYGKLKMMFPLISNLAEIRRTKKILKEVQADLKKEKVPFDKDTEVGIMIEVPSAALTSDLLANEVDFFSIGSNDLIQYALAVDRGNEKIAHLYQPTHPAILRLIKQVIDNGHAASIWVGMCGEMASDPSLAVLLMGMGIDELSLSAVLVPKVKNVIRSVRYEDAQSIAEQCLNLNTSDEIRSYLDRRLTRLLKAG